jgi:acetyl esterase/lipase/D-serine deaminase-like pyridoxal phosphate-dependent protein
MEQNEAAMRHLMHGSGVSLRPHAKAHKSSRLAAWHMQRHSNSTSSTETTLTGFCAQTVAEAEMLVRAGASDILVTNSLPPRAATSLVALAAAHSSITFGTLVDCHDHVAALSAAAAAVGCRNLRVLVEIECGMDRCGVVAGSNALVSLARAILAASSHLEWGGLHVYAGQLGQVASASERRAAVASHPATAARVSVERLQREGIAVPCVTGGGTGTCAMDLDAGTHTELQPGSYLLMDDNYNKNEWGALNEWGGVGVGGGGGGGGGCGGGGRRPFEQALFVHATVISADEIAGKRVLDAGSKAVDLLAGAPRCTSLFNDTLAQALVDVVYSEGGCEHGMLRRVPSGMLRVGETVQLVPSDLYSTVNRHACLVGIRGRVVEEIFPIDGRYAMTPDMLRLLNRPSRLRQPTATDTAIDTTQHLPLLPPPLPAGISTVARRFLEDRNPGGNAYLHRLPFHDLEKMAVLRLEDGQYALAGCRTVLAETGCTVENGVVGGVPVQWVHPGRGADSLGGAEVVLYMFGGGFVRGRPEDDLSISARLAHKTQRRVCVPRYRLAPEHPFPAARDDVMAVYRALCAPGGGKGRGSGVVVAGESAGGNLAWSLVLRVAAATAAAAEKGHNCGDDDMNLPLPQAVALLSPWIDLTHGGDSHVTLAAVDPVLSVPNFLDPAAAAYAGGRRALDSPDISPLFAAVPAAVLMPPTIISTGTRDLLLSDSTRLAAKMRAAGAVVDLRVAEGMWHVFEWYPQLPEAKTTMDEIGQFLSAHMVLPSPGDTTSCGRSRL